MYRHPSDRRGLKQDAKATLRAYSPGIFLISLVLLAVLIIPQLVEQRSTGFSLELTDIQTPEQLTNALEKIVLQIESHPGRYQLISLFSALISLFQTIVQYSFRRYCLKASRGEEVGGIEEAFSCFAEFLRYFLLNILIAIFVFLWSLLLIVPGIIASFAYSQAPYLMMDDPTLSPLKALRMSKKLMRGHKWEYFVLLLSFFGWLLLSALTMNLLDLWLQPYMYLTDAHYFNALIGWQPAAAGGTFESDPEPEVTDWWKN